MHRTVMNHKLRILILKHLKKRPRAGYGLSKDIHEATGWKPSYGSLYPELERLKKEGLLSCKEEGRKKIYSLTTKGKEAAKLIKLHDSEVAEQLDRWQKLMMHLCGIQGKELPISQMLQQTLNPDETMKEVLKESHAMKLEFARLMQNGLMEKHKKTVIRIIRDGTRELKKLT